jgi:peptidoglycan/LPS O-acetylase OafA/YrhL
MLRVTFTEGVGASTLAPPRGNPRFPQVDAMRAIAALSVVIYHSAMIGGIAAPGFLGAYVAHLNVGVPLFFVISGFLLYRPFVSARLSGTPPIRWGPYLLRRALRIVPAYWVALTVLTVLWGLPGVFTADWWRYYGLVQIYAHRTIDQGMGVAWTLCIEVTFYLALPLVDLLAGWVSGALRTRSGGLPAGTADLLTVGAIAAASLAFTFIAFAGGIEVWATLNLLGTFDWFALGMAVAVLTVVRPGLQLQGAALYWLLAAVTLVAVVQLDSLEGKAWIYYPLLHVGYGLIAVLLFLPAVTAGEGLARRVLSARWLMWVGLVSYSVYLYHATLIPPLRNRGVGSLLPINGWVTMSVAAIAVGLPVAAVSYYVVEARFAALGSRILRTRKLVPLPQPRVRDAATVK